jgi:hypothetical protein
MTNWARLSRLIRVDEYKRHLIDSDEVFTITRGDIDRVDGNGPKNRFVDCPTAARELVGIIESCDDTYRAHGELSEDERAWSITSSAGNVRLAVRQREDASCLDPNEDAVEVEICGQSASLSWGEAAEVCVALTRLLSDALHAPSSS